MKTMYTLALVISLFYNTAFAIEIISNQPIILTDFDDVWIKKSSFLGLLSYLQPLESLFKRKADNKDVTSTPTEKKSTRFNNFTLRFLDYGRRYPRLASYIPNLLEYIGKSRYLNQPIDDLYHHLKNNGYHLVIATNKDHFLYDLAIKKLGNEIPNMVDKVFVAEPKNNETAISQLQAFANKTTTPINYKKMALEALNLKETKDIIHVPNKKPAKEYFIYVIEHIGADKDIIFIDDNKKNVDAFNALQKDTSKLRLGILYDENNLNQFVENIKKAGLISEEKDKTLLNEIRYPGITGKIKQYMQQTANRMKAATS